MLLYKLKEKGCIGIEIDKNTPGFADEKKYIFQHIMQQKD